MRLFGTFVLFSMSLCAFSQVPDPIITTMDSYSGHATIAGRLNAKPEGPVGVSVRNGNLMYSTITDLDGRWGIVIRHQAVNINVYTWDLQNRLDRSLEQKRGLPLKQN